MNITYEHALKAAEEIEVEPEAIFAVIRVETPYPHVGDTPKGKPIILNERHWFYKLSGRYPVSSTHPHLSQVKAGGYCTGKDWIERQDCEHERLAEKMRIYGGVLKEPALKSISMGLFQVMGFNHNVIGYNSVFDMWEDAQAADDTIDLRWFLEYVKVNKLDDELRRHDWAGFARGYNGPNYKINKYDIKLAEAFKYFMEKYKDFEESEDVVKSIATIPWTDYIPQFKELLSEMTDMIEKLETEFPDFSQIDKI